MLREHLILWSPLQESFDRLSSAAQNMFLDIVSVMQDFEEARALAIWSGWHEHHKLAWEELQRCSFVTVRDNKLVVHYVVKSLGQSIICYQHSEFFASRVWTDLDGKLTDFGPVRGSKQRAAISCV